MQYAEALAYFQNALKRGVKPGLSRIEALLAELGHPERQFRAVQVAGTNGKGSCAAIVARALTLSGERCGLFTTPAVLDYREQISVDGAWIPEEAFARLTVRVRAAADRVARLTGEEPLLSPALRAEPAGLPLPSVSEPHPARASSGSAHAGPSAERPPLSSALSAGRGASPRPSAAEEAARFPSSAVSQMSAAGHTPDVPRADAAPGPRSRAAGPVSPAPSPLPGVSCAGGAPCGSAAAEAAARIPSAASSPKAAPEALYGAPTEFELVTALGFLYFAERGCTVAVVEAGLGGLGDATNVLPRTEVAVLTRIGLDHTAILGSTLTEIAQQKCGIIKPGCAVVSTPAQRPEAAAEIRAAADALSCPLLVPGAPRRAPDGPSLHRDALAEPDTHINSAAASSRDSRGTRTPADGPSLHRDAPAEPDTHINSAAASPRDSRGTRTPTDGPSLHGDTPAEPDTHINSAAASGGESARLFSGPHHISAGIPRPGEHLHTDGAPPDHLRAISDSAAPDPFGGAELLEIAPTGCRFRFEGRNYRTPYGPEMLPTVLTAITAAAAAGADCEAVRRAVRETRLPMRQERLCRGDSVLLLDGGHNPDAMRALCARIDREAQGRPVVAVCGMLRDKACAECVPLLARRCARLILTEPRSPRRAEAASLAALAAGDCPRVETEPEPARALLRAGLLRAAVPHSSANSARSHPGLPTGPAGAVPRAGSAASAPRDSVTAGSAGFTAAVDPGSPGAGTAETFDPTGPAGVPLPASAPLSEAESGAPFSTAPVGAEAEVPARPATLRAAVPTDRSSSTGPAAEAADPEAAAPPVSSAGSPCAGGCGGCPGCASPAGTLYVVCGSFYLCGEARGLLLSAGWQ